MSFTPDALKASDGVRVAAGVPLLDRLGWKIDWTIRRYSEAATRIAARHGLLLPTVEDFADLGLAPYKVSRVPGNLLTTAGITRIVTLLTAGTGNKLTSTTCRVGVGNGGGSAAIGDTDLSAAAGSANRWFQTCTVTSPSNVLTFAAVFASADGNFAWTEFGIDIGTATVTSSNAVGAELLNHKTAIAQGTKASGQTWNATATVTFS